MSETHTYTHSLTITHVNSAQGRLALLLLPLQPHAHARDTRRAVAPPSISLPPPSSPAFADPLLSPLRPPCCCCCRAEAEFVLCLYKHMLCQVPELQDGTASVAVISPYKAQVS